MTPKLRHFLLWCFALVFAGPLAGDIWASAGNILSCKLPGESPISLLAVNDPARGPIWGQIRNKTIHFPPVTLRVSGREVVSLDVSADCRWLLVVAASEGHTVLTVFDIGEISNAAQSRRWRNN